MATVEGKKDYQRWLEEKEYQRQQEEERYENEQVELHWNCPFSDIIGMKV